MKAPGEGKKNKAFQMLEGKEPERVNLCNHSLGHGREVFTGKA